MNSEAIISELMIARASDRLTHIALQGGWRFTVHLPEDLDDQGILVPHGFNQELAKGYNEDARWKSSIRVSPPPPGLSEDRLATNPDFHSVLVFSADVTVTEPAGDKFTVGGHCIDPEKVVAVWSDRAES